MGSELTMQEKNLQKNDPVNSAFFASIIAFDILPLNGFGGRGPP